MVTNEIPLETYQYTPVSLVGILSIFVYQIVLRSRLNVIIDHNVSEEQEQGRLQLHNTSTLVLVRLARSPLPCQR